MQSMNSPHGGVRCCWWIGAELKDPPKFDGTTDTVDFVEQMEAQIEPEQWIAALDITLAETLARWWATHKSMLQSWEDTAESLHTRFLPTMGAPPGSASSSSADRALWFGGGLDPVTHVNSCEVFWAAQNFPSQQWVHKFVQTLEPLLMNWYLHAEMQQQTRNWLEL